MKRKTLISGYKKRGNAFLDTLLVILVLTIISIVAIFGNKIFSDLNDEFQTDDDLSNVSKQTIGDLETNYPSVMDGIFLTAFVLFWILALVGSWQVDASPIFLIISVLLIGFLLFVGAIMSNTHEEISADPGLTDFAAEFPVTNFIMGNLVFVILAIGFSVIIVLYGKGNLN